jgi:polyphosphate kinase
MSESVLVSVGDHAFLNAELPETLSEAWIDRDISWLDFNCRVLEEALDTRTPLLERAKFLAIFTSNLDEFYMKRDAVLRQGKTEGQIGVADQLRDKLLPMLRRQAECYRHVLVPGLAAAGVFLRRWDELTPAQQQEASTHFEANISPAITPLIIDPAQPFPFLANLSTSIVFQLKNEERSEFIYGRVKVPTGLKHWLALSAEVPAGQMLLVSLEEVIRGNLHQLYAGMTIGAITVVRLTRDAEVELDDVTAAGLRALVKEQVRLRRYEPVVRLEFGPRADPVVKEMLRARFHLTANDMFDLAEEVDYTILFELLGLPLPGLLDPPWVPLPPPGFQEGTAAMFAAIHAEDLLVHHPYESFDASVEHFISAAADDPQTVSIKMTAYRIGDDTPFVKSLIRAAEHGKQVACVMEIKASFDEERNLFWAAELERVGAHVTFGVAGLKTHAKTALVVRKEADGLRSYVHIATGNYHVKTARLYADLGLFTCDPKLTHDVVNLFHYLTGRQAHAPVFQQLLVAPESMRPRLLELIHREIEHKLAGRPARIVAKMNQLEDPEMIEALCAASQAGVSVDLIIRGFCCLRPGIPGRSENVRVRSIIGRFLEHSRIFHFANGHQDPNEADFYIGSADWMFRNLSRRIEVVTPVLAANLRQRLWTILDICLRDQRQAWILGTDGVYTQLRPKGDPHAEESLGTHQVLMNLARARAGA